LTFDGRIPDHLAKFATNGGSTVRIPSPDPGRTVVESVAALSGSDYRIQSMEIIQPSLDAVFLSLTGRRYSPAGDTSPHAEVAPL